MKKILLVEDNPGDMVLAREALQQAAPLDFELEVVDTLGGAVESLGKGHFDVVLLDLSLPDSGSQSTLPRIVEADPDVPIVILSGHVSDLQAREAIRLGAQDLILKDELNGGSLLIRTIHYAVERKRSERLMAERALYDTLTALPTRALLQDRWSGAKTRARRHSGWIGILFIDLDGFKAINDLHGHALGDRVLVAVAERMRAVVRDQDTIARHGGDEFVILLEAVHGADDARGVASKLAEAIEQPIHHEGVELYISASIGIAICHHAQSDELEDLINRADRDMYKRKGAQRQLAAVPSGQGAA